MEGFVCVGGMLVARYPLLVWTLFLTGNFLLLLLLLLLSLYEHVFRVAHSSNGCIQIHVYMHCGFILFTNKHIQRWLEANPAGPMRKVDQETDKWQSSWVDDQRKHNRNSHCRSVSTAIEKAETRFPRRPGQSGKREVRWQMQN